MVQVKEEEPRQMDDSSGHLAQNRDASWEHEDLPAGWTSAGIYQMLHIYFLFSSLMLVKEESNPRHNHCHAGSNKEKPRQAAEQAAPRVSFTGQNQAEPRIRRLPASRSSYNPQI